MKTKIFISTFLTIALVFQSNAQLKVFSNGYIGAFGVTTPLAPLHINGNTYLPGNNSYWINSTSDNGIRLRMHVSTLSTGAYIDFYPTLSFRSGATSSTDYYPLTLQGNCVGINNTNPSHSLDVTGTAYVNGNVVFTSDARLKKNITNLQNPIDSLFKLQGVSYDLKMPVVPGPKAVSNSVISKPDSQVNPNDTIGKNPPYFFIDSALYAHHHYGFLAQDVQKIYPQLVYKDNNGLLSIDYIGIIPLLLEAIKQEKLQLDSLKQLINKKSDGPLKSSTLNEDTTIITKGTGLSLIEKAASLGQNSPNPFNQNTSISYYLPGTIKNAAIYIYNMQGNQIKVIPINTNGNGSVVIYGSELSPGMYLYALIADEQEIATRRMILTQ